MIKPGVATGDQVQEIFKLAKSKKFALPAVNVIGSSSINGVLEISKELNSPVIIQFSNGGAIFNAGKGMDMAIFTLLGVIGPLLFAILVGIISIGLKSKKMNQIK